MKRMLSWATVAVAATVLMGGDVAVCGWANQQLQLSRLFHGLHGSLALAMVRLAEQVHGDGVHAEPWTQPN